jgi:ATPase subunit of ABC transporter with duplicated ATPase domains
MLLWKPDLLLLDEPTNHLDAESVNWLERHLAEYAGTVVAVTHDRYFLDNVAQWILEIDRGRGFPFEGNYTSWLVQKQARLQLEEKAASARSKTLARELEWIRMGAKARQAKSKARISAYEKMAAEQFQDKDEEFELQIPPGKPLGDLVIEAGHPKSYDDACSSTTLASVYRPAESSASSVPTAPQDPLPNARRPESPTRAN